MKLLVSVPTGVYSNSVYLPYIWALLKTYLELNYNKDVNVTWLDPIFLKTHEASYCDIFLTSNYTWNWQENLELTKNVKKLNPNCYVIAGGPQVPFKDKKVFDLYENVDALCFQEGEQVLSEFLYRFTNNLDLDIDGIILKTNPNKTIKFAKKLNLNDCYSPWKHCFNDLMRFSKEIHSHKKRVIVALETNRGCPYKCSFCDWGMDINSKIRLVNEDVVFESIEYISKLQPDTITIVDANYGSFQHDLDYVKKIVKNKQETTFPESVIFFGAKNNKKLVNDCYKVLFDDGMIGMIQVSFNHTDAKVLKNIDRGIMKREKFMEEMQESFMLGIPLVAFLILGNPGDTIEKWKNTWSDLLEMGFHEDIKVSDFFVLPNAPAAQPEYIEKFKIKTHIRNHADTFKNRDFVKGELIIESYSFDKEDFKEMQLISAFIQGTHILSITKFIAMALYHNKGIRYKTFYEDFIKFKTISKIIDHIKICLDNYMLDPTGIKFTKFQGTYVLYEDFIYLSCLENLDSIYNELEKYLHTYFNPLLVTDIITFSKNSILNLNAKNSFLLNYNLKEYFKTLLALPPTVRYDKDPTKKSTYVFISDKRLGYNKEINFDKINNLDNIRDKILRASNFRHKTTYWL
jgi:putative methyltransferase